MDEMTIVEIPERIAREIIKEFEKIKKQTEGGEKKWREFLLKK